MSERHGGVGPAEEHFSPNSHNASLRKSKDRGAHHHSQSVAEREDRNFLPNLKNARSASKSSIRSGRGYSSPKKVSNKALAMLESRRKREQVKKRPIWIPSGVVKKNDGISLLAKVYY